MISPLHPATVTHILTTARELAVTAIDGADHAPATLSGAEREQLAADYLTKKADEVLEGIDQLVPVIGQYLDLPPVNACEAVAVRALMAAFVRQVYKEERQ